MDCESCSKRAPEPVPYLAHESAMARAERIIKRLWVLAVILIVLLVATNGLWIWYESQWEDIVVTQDNAEGYNSYIGNDGDIYNGTTDDKNPEA